MAFDRTLVAPFGFEPKTDYLEGSCSIQLSYGVENGANKCRGGRIRTYDLLVPNQARYRATLHPEKLPYFKEILIDFRTVIGVQR